MRDHRDRPCCAKLDSNSRANSSSTCTRVEHVYRPSSSSRQQEVREPGGQMQNSAFESKQNKAKSIRQEPVLLVLLLLFALEK